MTAGWGTLFPTRSTVSSSFSMRFFSTAAGMNPVPLSSVSLMLFPWASANWGVDAVDDGETFMVTPAESKSSDRGCDPVGVGAVRFAGGRSALIDLAPLRTWRLRWQTCVRTRPIGLERTHWSRTRTSPPDTCRPRSAWIPWWPRRTCAIGAIWTGSVRRCYPALAQGVTRSVRRVPGGNRRPRVLQRGTRTTHSRS